MCGALETADFRREALKQFNTGVLVAKSRHHSGTGVSASTKMATLRLISFPGVTAYSDSLKTNERDRSTAEKHKMKAFEFTIHKKSHLISEAQTAIHDGPPRSEIEVGVWHGVQALLWAELVNSVPHPPQFSVALVCWINHLQWPCKEVPEDPGVSWLDLFVDFRLATGVLAPIAEGSFEGNFKFRMPSSKDLLVEQPGSVQLKHFRSEIKALANVCGTPTHPDCFVTRCKSLLCFPGGRETTGFGIRPALVSSRTVLCIFGLPVNLWVYNRCYIMGYNFLTQVITCLTLW